MNELFFPILPIFSLIITLLIMPKIIGVVTYKKLMDEPNQRSSHQKKTPSLGGIAFFIVITLGILIVNPIDTDGIALSLLVAVIILFLVGLKDDLVVLSPISKLLTQFFAIILILSNPNFQFTELHGFLGLSELPIQITISLSALLMVYIINAYNLIDGIDGLAASIGIIAFSVFGLIFYLLDEQFYFGISLVLIGTLVGFLRFNLSSKQKIFMGDTGSLVIGFLIAVFTIRLICIEPMTLKRLPFQIENLPILILAILIVPLFDTARVFTIRVFNKKGPFTPDRNHIHHILIDYLNLSHRKASFFIGIFNIVFIAIFLFLCANFDNMVTLTSLVFVVAIMVYLFYRINFSYKNIRRKLVFKRTLKRVLTFLFF